MENSEEKRSRFIAGLRLLADILETKPEMPLPSQGFRVFCYGKEGFVRALKGLIACGLPVVQRSDDANGIYPYHRAVVELEGLTFEVQVGLKEIGSKQTKLREVEVFEVDPDILAGKFEEPRNLQVAEPLRSVINTIAPEA